MGWRERLIERFVGDYIERRVQNAVDVRDQEWFRRMGGAVGPADRPWSERDESLADALDAWRKNPLARRIVALTTDYIVGNGVEIHAKSQQHDTFLQRFWTHRQNRMDMRLAAWCDELTRAGELFIVLSTNPVDGMSYVRAIPARRIAEVVTDPEDLEHETAYKELAGWTAGGMQLEGRTWPAFDWLKDDPAAATQVILHYAINRPVGATRGEGDLAPVLKWIQRYGVWVEDRVRINRFQSAFVWDVTVPDHQVEVKRAQYRKPPDPGSLMIHGPEEKWAAVKPEIQAQEVKDDGRVLRMMIAAGASVPLHFISDPEGSTQTTAAESNEPSFRHYSQRQAYFTWLLQDLATVVMRRAHGLGRLGRWWPEDLGLSVTVTDLRQDDNLKLAQAAADIVQAFGELHTRGLLPADELVRLAYKFAGELVDPADVLDWVKNEPPVAPEVGPGDGAQNQSFGLAERF